MRRLRIKKLELAIALGLILTVLTAGTIKLYEDCADIRDKTLRLHIIANSDSAEDQAVKLKVRDRVLQEIGTELSEAANKEDALTLLTEKIDVLNKLADEVLTANGKSARSDAYVGRVYFPTRVYEDFTLPAGDYMAVNIVLGDGEGKNWWCVMYPGLCLPPSEKQAVETGYTKDEERLIRSGYEVKFLTVEVIERIKRLFAKKS